MCGIAGGISWQEQTQHYLSRLPVAMNSLHRRGPDSSGVWIKPSIALGHTRLSIIDTTAVAQQPFVSADERYILVFNGEIFNYQEHRLDFEREGFQFRSQSDTEVLLALWIKHGVACLPLLNGFFAFAIYDTISQELFLARDRFGEKPLIIYREAGVLLFASEMKALLTLGIPRMLNTDVLHAYLHLNYLPESILQHTEYLQPGCWMCCTAAGEIRQECWYQPEQSVSSMAAIPSFEEATIVLQDKLTKAVQRRLVADVPLGAFLSGGIDSSIIAAIAARKVSGLHTFSVGFPEEPHFDETHYAKRVAKHIGAKHTVFPVTRKELFTEVDAVLEYLDEPFADSSALAVFVLSKSVRKEVTVALSGDGADELFAGYNKHRAAWLAEKNGLKNALIRLGAPVWQMLPASRNSKTGNIIRQLRRFAEGLHLAPAERYWRWAGYTRENEVNQLLLPHLRKTTSPFTSSLFDIDFTQTDQLNAWLEADLKLVLPNDMLVKVDRMSMSNALEVRPPFLDHELADWVRQLPSIYKIDATGQKLLLKAAFKNYLPDEIFTRRKQGFEVPILNWLRTDLRLLQDELFSEAFLRKQNLFVPETIQQLRRQLHSTDPGDAASRVWGLFVFQWWWRKLFL